MVGLPELFEQELWTLRGETLLKQAEELSAREMLLGAALAYINQYGCGLGLKAEPKRAGPVPFSFGPLAWSGDEVAYYLQMQLTQLGFERAISISGTGEEREAILDSPWFKLATSVGQEASQENCELKAPFLRLSLSKAVPPLPSSQQRKSWLSLATFFSYEISSSTSPIVISVNLSYNMGLGFGTKEKEGEQIEKDGISLKPRLQDSGQGYQIDEKHFPSYGEEILSLISLVPELLLRLLTLHSLPISFAKATTYLAIHTYLFLRIKLTSFFFLQKASTREAMVLGDCRTFPQLFEEAARMQRSLKDGSITLLTNSSNGEEGKPKNTLRTQQPTKEVTITPQSALFREE
ncbi:histidine ammonia-lyase [Striga asiatica]|uniref:Histidine ammonia-lyase n=1 Tax=Striga asiatica TaxID=4170 RepID=A0A5A7R382_STRAF|nr:histidine ammonia-lyase [Striga asiatica]